MNVSILSRSSYIQSETPHYSSLVTTINMFYIVQLIFLAHITQLNKINSIMITIILKEIKLMLLIKCMHTKMHLHTHIHALKWTWPNPFQKSEQMTKPQIFFILYFCGGKYPLNNNFLQSNIIYKATVKTR